MKRVAVSVKDDYLERMSKTRPINAVAQLVWNSLDADADKIKVKLFENEIGGLEKLIVRDNGHGLEYDAAEQAFGNLGGSWKKKEQKTRLKKRFLHGRQGKGRFTAFALGQAVEWKSKYKSNGSLAMFSVVGKRDSLGTFEIGDVERTQASKTGMEGIAWHGWHAFRRGLATNLRAMGTPDDIITRMLRHGDIATAQRYYSKTLDLTVRTAMEKFEVHVQ